MTNRSVWVVETWLDGRGWVPFGAYTNREAAWWRADAAREQWPGEKFKTVAYTRKFA